jgi:hypothetical protein
MTDVDLELSDPRHHRRHLGLKLRRDRVFFDRSPTVGATRREGRVEDLVDPLGRRPKDCRSMLDS